MREEDDDFDRSCVFPRWRSHARPRLQIIKVFLDVHGGVLHVDKERRYDVVTRHEWNQMINQVHTLPDKKRAEVFETHRNLKYQFLTSVWIRWPSSDGGTLPTVSSFQTPNELLSALCGASNDLLVTDPSTRKRCGVVLFLQPSRDTAMAVLAKEEKRHFRLKSAMTNRRGGGACGGALKSRKKERVEIFGVRDPLNAQNEQQLVARKKQRRS